MRSLKLILFLQLAAIGCRLVSALSDQLVAFESAADQAKQEVESIKSTFDNFKVYRPRRRTIYELLANFRNDDNYPTDRDSDRAGDGDEEEDSGCKPTKCTKKPTMCTRRPHKKKTKTTPLPPNPLCGDWLNVEMAMRNRACNWRVKGLSGLSTIIAGFYLLLFCYRAGKKNLSVQFSIIYDVFVCQFVLPASVPLQAFHRAVEDAKDQLHSIKATFGLDNENLARQRRRTIDELLANWQKDVNMADEIEQLNNGVVIIGTPGADDRQNRDSCKPNCGDGECPPDKGCVNMETHCGKPTDCGTGNCGGGSTCPDSRGLTNDVVKKEVDWSGDLNEIAKLDKKYKFSDYRPYKVPPPMPIYLGKDVEVAETDRNNNNRNSGYREMSKEDHAKADRFLNELHFDNIEDVRNAFKMDEKAPLAVTYDEAVANIYYPGSKNNDQTDTKKNDLSHEADYKLSKIEQEASEKDKNIKWKQKPLTLWTDAKKRNTRMLNFNPMGEIKLLTSHRLMNKGYGASLPSYSLTDYKRERMIDDMLREIDGSKDMLHGIDAPKEEKYTDLDKVDYLMNSGDDSTFGVLKSRIKRLNQLREQRRNHERNLPDLSRQDSLSAKRARDDARKRRSEKVHVRTKRISKEQYQEQRLAADKLVAWQKQLASDLERWRRQAAEQKAVNTKEQEKQELNAAGKEAEKKVNDEPEKSADKRAEHNKADKTTTYIDDSDYKDSTKVNARVIMPKQNSDDAKDLKEEQVKETTNNRVALAQHEPEVKNNKEDSKSQDWDAEEKLKPKRRAKRVDSMKLFRERTPVREGSEMIEKEIWSLPPGRVKIRKKRYVGTEYDILDDNKDFDTFEANEDEMRMRVKRSALNPRRSSGNLHKRVKRDMTSKEQPTKVANTNTNTQTQSKHNIEKRSSALDDEDDNNSDIWRMSGNPQLPVEDDDSEIKKDYDADDARKKRLPIHYGNDNSKEFDFGAAVGSYGNQKFDNLNQDKTVSTFEGTKFDNLWYDNSNHKLELDNKFNSIVKDNKHKFDTSKNILNDYDTNTLVRSSKNNVNRNAKTSNTNLKKDNKITNKVDKLTNNKDEKDKKNYVSLSKYLDYVISQVRGMYNYRDNGGVAGAGGSAGAKNGIKSGIKSGHSRRSGHSHGSGKSLPEIDIKDFDRKMMNKLRDRILKAPAEIVIKDSDKDMVLKLRDEILNCNALNKLEGFLKSLPCNKKKKDKDKTSTDQPDTAEEKTTHKCLKKIKPKPKPKPKPATTTPTPTTTTAATTQPPTTTTEAEEETEATEKSNKSKEDKEDSGSCSTCPPCPSESGGKKTTAASHRTSTEANEEEVIPTIPTSPWPKPMLSNKPKCPPEYDKNSTAKEREKGRDKEIEKESDNDRDKETEKERDKDTDKDSEKEPDNEPESPPTSWSEKEKSEDEMKVNISIKASVVSDKKGNDFHGNGSINVQSGLKSDEQNQVKRAAAFPGYEKCLPKPKNKSCDQGDNQNPPMDMLTGKLSTQVVRKIFQMVRNDPKLKTLWPSLKRNRPSDRKQVDNFYAIRNKNTEKSVCETEKMLRRMMETINSMIDEQVRTQTCVPLRPDLYDFYELILETHEEQEQNRQKREDNLSLANAFSAKLRTIDPNMLEEKTAVVKKLLKQYEDLPRQDQEQVIDIRDDLLMDLVYLRKLQDGVDIMQERRKREIVQQEKLNLNANDVELMKKLEGKYTPEFLKLLKTSELFREAAAGIE